MEYEEHEKRAWSVDFSRTEPSMLVSGSDDCKVFVSRNDSVIFCYSQRELSLSVTLLGG
jgi:E3 ubiquitin-protein ligase RFWD2